MLPTHLFQGEEKQLAEISRGISPTATKAILAIVIIAIVAIASFTLLGTQPTPITPGSATLADDNDRDVDLFPAYLRAEFTVNASQVRTGTAPSVQFNVTVADTGEDVVVVTIHVAVYDLNQTTFDSLGTIIDLEPYEIEQIEEQTDLSGSIALDNEAKTYVWLVAFMATEKIDVWSVDILITLLYNQ